MIKDQRGHLRLGRLGALASVSTFALIVFGGLVRITGSGMGCGDHWPLCNGSLLPPLDLPTLIEYGHRLAALFVALLVCGVAVTAWLANRRQPGSGRSRTGSAARAWSMAGLAVFLLVVQILLGAITVWLELPAASVIMHLGTAMVMLALLVLITLEAYAPGRPPLDDRATDLAIWTSMAGLGVVLLGALTANLDAGHACQGFPLCNGSLIPAGNPLVHTHWTHRLAAYGLVGWCLALPLMIRRVRPDDRPLAKAAWLAAAVVLAQLAIGAGMVLMNLESGMRAAHVGLGAAVFVSLVRLAWLARYPAQPMDSSSAT